MGRSLGLAIYLWAMRHADGFARRKLDERLAAGKEHPDRLSERLGRAGIARPEGPLIWFHAASVGEILSLVELIRRLRIEIPEAGVLVTSGTVTSAEMAARRMPKAVIHQFAPVDTRGAVRAFLDHWRPDLAIWTESELWPTMIHETHARGIPMLLVNARMSQRSSRRWRLARGIARSLLCRFDRVLAQDEATAAHLAWLGMPADRVEVTGTLKEGSAALPCDETERQRMVAALGRRPVWLAASTHDGEEAMAACAHRRAARSAQGLLLILCPRHPERGDAIAAELREDGWDVAQRSRGEGIRRETQIYLADTLGELGLWYRVAPISFLGGSLVPVGGHNPFEPAALGSAIIHGPHVQNFRDIYHRLHEADAAVEVTDEAGLARAVEEALNPDVAARLAHNAWEVSSAGAEVTDIVLDAVLQAYFARGSGAGAGSGPRERVPGEVEATGPGAGAGAAARPSGGDGASDGRTGTGDA